MALADILRARADALRRTARVECGDLGGVTVEALPLRELELLLRQPDPMRAVFYAACRELQHSGEELRKAGQVYAPDEIMQMVSGPEAELAARTVLELSGWRQPEVADLQRNLTQDAEGDLHPDADTLPVRSGSAVERDRSLAFAAGGGDPEQTTAEPAQTQTVALKKNGEIRLPSVQEMKEGFQEIRPESVQALEVLEVSRLSSVQENKELVPDFGQDSHETVPSGAWAASRLPAENESKTRPTQNETFASATDKKVQGLVAFPKSEVQNVVSGQNAALKKNVQEQGADVGLHENESEVFGRLHEIKSDFGRGEIETTHETESDFREQLHETTSEVSPNTGEILHEMEPDLAVPMHENKSEVSAGVHDIRSDFSRTAPESLHENTSEVRKRLHETESELAERVARRLLEGLRRAAAVR